MRIFCKRLEPAATKGRALHVDGRTQPTVRPFCNALVAQQLPRLVYQIAVPGGAQSRAAGQTCGGDASEEFRAPYAIGTVGGANRRDVELGDGMCVPKISSCFLLAEQVPKKHRLYIT